MVLGEHQDILLQTSLTEEIPAIPAMLLHPDRLHLAITRPQKLLRTNHSKQFFSFQEANSELF